MRERVNSLRGVYAAEMPYRDPHTAGSALWAWVHSKAVKAGKRFHGGPTNAEAAALVAGVTPLGELGASVMSGG